MPDTTTRPWLCPRDETCPSNTHDSHGAHRMGCESGAAREARRLYLKRWKHGRNPSAFTDPTGVRRRIEACHYMGWSGTEIAKRVDVDRRHIGFLRRGDRNEQMLVKTHDRMVPILDRMAMYPAPDGLSASKTRNWARRQGFCPLLAWDDIDDPDEQPAAPADELAQRRPKPMDRYARVEIDERLLESVLEPNTAKFAGLSVPEQDHVVERLWRDAVAEGYEEPGKRVAQRLEVEHSVIARIRSREYSRRNRQQEAS